MNDWNEYRERLTLRLREFSKLAPETMRASRHWVKQGRRQTISTRRQGSWYLSQLP